MDDDEDVKIERVFRGHRTIRKDLKTLRVVKKKKKKYMTSHKCFFYLGTTGDIELCKD
jgi:hypothetical protein